MLSKKIVFLRGFETARSNASKWVIWVSRLKVQMGRLTNVLGIPGLLQPLENYDELTNTHLTIKLSPLYTKVSINGRDYYFDRLTGRFDGTGSGCN